MIIPPRVLFCSFAISLDLSLPLSYPQPIKPRMFTESYLTFSKKLLKLQNKCIEDDIFLVNPLCKGLNCIIFFKVK